MYKKYLYAVVLQNGKYLEWQGKVQWYELAEAKKKLRIFDGIKLQRGDGGSAFKIERG
jgi:hypothetical protein